MSRVVRPRDQRIAKPRREQSRKRFLPRLKLLEEKATLEALS